jgi:hypothetical protein
MRRHILTGSALALAVFAMGSTSAAACDDDCDYCGGYGYYAASYGYYARPAYAYVPGPYYAAPAYYAPAYAYYAPAYAPAYYAPSPAYYAPYGYRSPYWGGRWGYVDAAGGRRKGVIPGVNPTTRGMYALGANPGPHPAKTLNASYIAPAAVKAPSSSHFAPAAAKAAKPSYDPRGVVAAPTKSPNPVARGISASAANPGKPAGNVPVAAGYGPQAKYLPTAYYGGYGSPRR